MQLYLLASVLVVFIVLVLGEIGWRKQLLHGELGRKFVHILVGSFVAFWPFFMTWTEIRWLSLAFLAVIIVSDRLKIFRAIHTVQRPTYGEIFFALVVGTLTFVTHSKGVYAAALLQMSLADGFAAVVGTKFGRGNSYRVFKHVKSVVGTLTFVVVSFTLLVGYSIFSVHSLPIFLAALGALGGAAIENVAPLGLDNLLVPLFIGLLLTKQ